MEIGRKFNELAFNEYQFYIDNYKKYKDFNTLGLYRSIIENDKLNIDQKINVREYAHKKLKKAFDFLQLKDPKIYVEVSTLGQEITQADEEQIWDNIRKNQQKILADKRIKHRNFGTYSKHKCPYPDCVYNGLMVRPGSRLAEMEMHFREDKNSYGKRLKSERHKSERKEAKEVINENIQLNS